MNTTKKTVKSLLFVSVSFSLIIGLSDCTSTSFLRRTKEKTVSPAKHGQSKSKDPANYAISASVVGGLPGTRIEQYMEQQTIQLRQQLGSIAQIERLGEGIKITFQSAILYPEGSYVLSNDPQPFVKKLAQVLQDFKDTEILVAGHTDSQGSLKVNQALSEKRAEALADFLQAHGVPQLRIVTEGFGETTPKVSNKTLDGRRQNQRVEVVVVANQRLKEEVRKAVESGSVVQN